MKFAADRTVGRLARWLRLLGYDTVFSNKSTNEEFLALANEGRILLSRNTELVKMARPDRFFLIGDNDPRAQLKMVLESLELTPDHGLFSRCTICNGVLEPVDRKAVFGRVPDHVWTAIKRFSQCGHCQKLYWPGSHLSRCRREMQRLFQRKDSGPKP